VLAQELDPAQGFAFGSFVLFFFLAAFVLAAIPFIGIFQKAGKPVWAAFIPVYNWYVLLQIVGRPGWWLVMLLIPIVSFIAVIVVMIDLAKSFGKGTGFVIGLIFLSWIFLLILGFGSATYLGPAAAGGARASGPGDALPPPPA